MNIEVTIKAPELAEAINNLAAAISGSRVAVATPGATPAPAASQAQPEPETSAPAEKPAPAKKAAKETKPAAPVVLPDPTPEPAEEPEAPASADLPEGFDRDAVIKEIQDIVRSKFVAAGANAKARQDEFAEIRKEWNIIRVNDLSDYKLLPFLEVAKAF